MVPLKPKLLTPANRRAPSTPSDGHGVSAVGTAKVVPSKEMCGLRSAKCRLGGICPRSTQSAALISPAIPAAASRWPRLVFTAPRCSGAPSARP